MKAETVLEVINALSPNEKVRLIKMLNTASALWKEPSGGSDGSVSIIKHTEKPALRRREKLLREAKRQNQIFPDKQ